MNYALFNNIATLAFDDGKANVVGLAFLDNINAGLDRAGTLQAMKDSIERLKNP